MKTKFVILSLAVMAMSVVTMAQTSTNKGKAVVTNHATTARPAYVDNNKNGVCDNYETRHANGTVGRGQRYGNGQGGGNGLGRGQGHGPNYVDKNNNGICDYRETSIQK